VTVIPGVTLALGAECGAFDRQPLLHNGIHLGYGVRLSTMPLFQRDRRMPMVMLSLVCLLGLGGALIAMGPTQIVLAPWDVFIILDEAWRLHIGQVPGIDFHNPVGPFTFELTSLAMNLVGPSLLALAVGNVFFLLAAGGAATFLSFRRLPPVYAFLFVLFIIVFVASTRQVGRPADLPTYCEIYNRWGWTLLCILCFQLFLPIKKGLPERTAIEGFIIGLVIGVALWTKVTFCALGAVAFLFAMLFHAQWRQSKVLLWAAIGAGIVTFIMWLLVHVNLFAYAADVLESGRAQTRGRRLGQMTRAFQLARPRFYVSALAWVILVLIPTATGRLALARAARATVIAGFVAALGLLTTFGNTGELGEIPLLTVFGLILLSETAAVDDPPGRSTAVRDWRYLLGAAVIIFGIFGPIFAQDVESVAISAAWRNYRVAGAPDSQRIMAAPLRDFIIPHNVEWTTEIWKSAQVPSRLNDGLSLARRYVSPTQSLLTLAFSNPIPYGLGLRPARGVPVWFDLDANYNLNNYRDPTQLFADVDFITIPIAKPGAVGGNRNVDTLQQIYGPYLSKHYTEVGRSTYWVLLKRHT
jgi:hypothetical protein